MIIGHRGAAALAPENTHSAIKKAADTGINWIEIDVQLTADDIPVIFHDETVNRCTDGRGKLARFTLPQLKQLDAGSWFSDQFINERIPTLQETLELCLDYKININLEIKIHHDEQVLPLIEKVSKVIELSDFPCENLLLSSFSFHAVRECQRIMPRIRRGYITESKTGDYLDKIEPLELYSLHVNYKNLRYDLAKAIKERGYILNVWTLNDPDKINALTKLGVDNIITDKPNIFSSSCCTGG